MGGVFLDAREQVERGAGAGVMAVRFQAHAHDAAEDQRQEADQGVRPDAIWQPVMDRGDLDVGFQHAKAALDIGEGLVAGHGFGGRQVGGMGQERELAVEEFRARDGIFLDAPTEPVGLQVCLEEAGLSASATARVNRP